MVLLLRFAVLDQVPAVDPDDPVADPQVWQAVGDHLVDGLGVHAQESGGVLGGEIGGVLLGAGGRHRAETPSTQWIANALINPVHHPNSFAASSSWCWVGVMFVFRTALQTPSAILYQAMTSPSGKPTRPLASSRK